jgi:hypothetical protein
MKLVARRALALGPGVVLRMLFDDGNDRRAEIAEGGHSQQIDGRQPFGQALLLKGLRNPIGKFVIKAGFFKAVDQIEIVGVIEDRRTGDLL